MVRARFKGCDRRYESQAISTHWSLETERNMQTHWLLTTVVLQSLWTTTTVAGTKPEPHKLRYPVDTIWKCPEPVTCTTQSSPGYSLSSQKFHPNDFWSAIQNGTNPEDCKPIGESLKSTCSIEHHPASTHPVAVYYHKTNLNGKWKLQFTYASSLVQVSDVMSRDSIN